MKQRRAIEVTGCTARQLDYWVRMGYIEPSQRGERSGRWHDFDDVALISAYALRWLVADMVDPTLVQKTLTEAPDAEYLIYARWSKTKERVGTLSDPLSFSAQTVDLARYVTIVPLGPVRQQLDLP